MSLKLVWPFVRPDVQPAKRAKPQAEPAISSELRKQIEALGVDPDQAEEVLRDAGIGVRVGDGN